MLRYSKPDREAAFRNYVTPIPRIASFIVYCLLPIGVYQAYAVLGNEANFSSSVNAALLLWNIMAIVVCFFGIAVFLIHRCCVPISSSKSRAALCWLHDCTWAVFCVAGFVQYRPQAVFGIDNGCDGDVFLYRQTANESFRDFNCWRRFQINTGLVLFVLCVILNVRFQECAVAAIVGVVCTPICLAIWPHRSIELNIADFIYTTALAMFITFTRYKVEKDQRAAYDVHEALARHWEELQSLSAEIEQLLLRLLPRTIISRSSSAKLRDRDIGNDAIALVMKVADFSNIATQRLQIRLTAALEQVMGSLTKTLTDCGLERVSVLLDEFVAVGNLLEPLNIRKALIGVCSGTIKLVKIQDQHSLPLVFGIDVGTAVGEFVGSANFMRYDVRGPTIDVARALATVGGAGEVLMSSAAVSIVNDAVVVRDGPHSIDITAVIENSFNSDPSCNPSDRSSTVSDASGFFILVKVGGDVAVAEVASMPVPMDIVSSIDSPPSVELEQGWDNPFLIVQAARLQSAVHKIGPLDSGLLRSCIYYRFHDDDLESKYVAWRMQANVCRGQQTWLVYSWVVVAFTVVLLLDMDEVRGSYGLVLFVIAAFASFAASQLPTMLRDRDISSWFHWWSALTLLIPVLVVTGMGISRPSAIGSDVRLMFTVGTIARMSSFAHAWHELLATPLLLLLSHLQFAAPGGAVPLLTVLSYVLAFVFVVGNASLDHTQRLAFAATRRISQAAKFMEKERELRMGLLRSTMPRPIFLSLARIAGRGGLVRTVADSHVVVISRVSSSRTSQQIPAEIPRAEDFDAALGEALSGLNYFHVCSVSGDRALVVAGVCATNEDANTYGKLLRSSESVLLLEMLTLATRMANKGAFRCIMDIDTTTQAVNTRHTTVTFSVYGVAVSRMVAIDTAAGEAVGVLATARVMMAISGTASLPFKLALKPLPTWRVRGVGQFQLTVVSLQ